MTISAPRYCRKGLPIRWIDRRPYRYFNNNQYIWASATTHQYPTPDDDDIGTPLLQKRIANPLDRSSSLPLLLIGSIYLVLPPTNTQSVVNVEDDLDNNEDKICTPLLQKRIANPLDWSSSLPFTSDCIRETTLSSALPRFGVCFTEGWCSALFKFWGSIDEGYLVEHCLWLWFSVTNFSLRRHDILVCQTSFVQCASIS